MSAMLPSSPFQFPPPPPSFLVAMQEMVDASYTGEMLYDDLDRKLKANAGKPAIVSINAGTTVKGAVDSLDRVNEVLKANGYTKSDTLWSWVTCIGPRSILPSAHMRLIYRS